MSEPEETIFSLREIQRQFEVPWDLELAMAQVAPQAILRDLHRPVTSFAVSGTDFESHERPTDCGRADLKQIHTDFARDLRVPIVDLLKTSRSARAAFKDLKALMALPWTDAPKLGIGTMPELMSRRYFGG